jgi:alkylation response protein AidB-like acyl-CoA dehydrogenase
MITSKTLKLSLKSLKDFAKKRLPDEVLRELDERDECPLEIVRHMCSPDKLGIQLLFIPEEFGGWAAAPSMCTASAKRWRASIWASPRPCWPRFWAAIRSRSAPLRAKENLADAHRGRGIVVRLRRHGAGSGQRFGLASHHGGPGYQNGRVVGYKINGNKQWISNGGIADAYTVLANTPSGPSWFIVEKGREGFHPRRAGR